MGWDPCEGVETGDGARLLALDRLGDGVAIVAGGGHSSWRPWGVGLGCLGGGCGPRGLRLGGAVFGLCLRVGEGLLSAMLTIKDSVSLRTWVRSEIGTGARCKARTWTGSGAGAEGRVRVSSLKVRLREALARGEGRGEATRACAGALGLVEVGVRKRTS